MERTGVLPHATARTAVVWETLSAELDRQADRELIVVDVGGGTGGFAVPLAQAGYPVTVVDPSPDALAALTRRAAEAGVPELVTAVQGDGDRLTEVVPAGTAGLVLCHSMLEVADDPAGVVRAVAGALRPGGAASVLVAGRAHAVLARAMSGHLAAAARLLRAGAEEAAVAPRRRFDPTAATALLTGAGLVLEELHGVRVLADLVPPAVAEADPPALLALEAELSTRLPYRDIASQLHLFARRPAAG
jgi:SAM-dependent methyltransferase